MLQPNDVRAYLLDHASRIAPADVDSLVARAADVREKTGSERGRHPLFYRQLTVALRLLADHASGRCAQIPYHTVCLLAAALYYWLEPLDAIPDFVPVAGTSDDALVLELACELGAAGLDRYCTFTGIPLATVLPGYQPR